MPRTSRHLQFDERCQIHALHQRAADGLRRQPLAVTRRIVRQSEYEPG